MRKICNTNTIYMMSISKKDKDLILELATLLFQNKISQEQSEVLQVLSEKNDDNRKYFRSIQDSWIATALYPDSKADTDTIETWNNISGKLDWFSEQKVQNTKKSKIFLRLIRIAAMWLFLVFIGATGSWFILNKPIEKSTSDILEITTPLGSRSMVRLPDGSKVWLNAGSKIRYSQNAFRKNREVYMEGEAYFDISKRHGDQFIVKTSDINIKVYGTRFNVRSYPEENEIQTTLVEGSIAIEQKTGPKSEKQLLLEPNQTAIFYKKIENKPVENAEMPEKVKVDRPLPLKNHVIINPEPEPIIKTSWKDENWVIEAKRLGDLAVDLERRYNVNITFKDESMKDFKYSGTLANETFDQVMKIVQLSAPVQFEYTINRNDVVLKYAKHK